ncbi:MAG TPA: hemerythrin domain-containing protein [Candidatus Binatia bacterium]|jgi:hemerythrin-like domain-containing protein|nr:hemerythrin domain-containing protein [Candidatus Binatia bacterium]
MLRDKNLIPLSHQHQHALALCVRIERASPIPKADLAAWQTEIAQIFQGEIRIHFAAEEEVLFPAARKYAELVPLVNELLSDHEWLRAQFATATTETVTPEEVQALATRLAVHIRKEERQLFEQLQERISAEEMESTGRKLDEALKASEQACILPTPTTRLKSAH